MKNGRDAYYTDENKRDVIGAPYKSFYDWTNRIAFTTISGTYTYVGIVWFYATFVKQYHP